MKKFTLFVALIFCFSALSAQNFNYPDAWGKSGFNLDNSRSGGVEITFSVPNFSLNDFQANGQIYKEIMLPGAFLPNDEGMPNVPGQGRYIALPQGATPILNIVSQRTEVIHNVDLVPAPNIPAENDDSPLRYVKNMSVYSQNANFPAVPVQISQVEQIRGVDVVMLGITPFQYNPVTRDLTVYHDIKVQITFDGGNGHFGNDAYRNRWFDPIIQDAVLNHESLPVIDYAKRFQTWRENMSRTDECEYIIISPTGPDFLAWADSIAAFRNQQGILSKVFPVDEVGGNDPGQIEMWIDNAYNTWTIKPVGVMMLGDYGSDITKNVTSPMITMSGETFPSDHKLGDVNGDDMAEIVFGRIVANNATQLNTICTKFLNYERNPPTDTSYYQHPITALGWQTERWFQLCSEIVGGYFRNVKGKHPVRINAIYQGTPGSIWSSATNTSTIVNYFGPSGLGYIPQTPAEMPCCWSGGTAAQINTAINDGSFLLQHRDHGEETGWGEPSYHNYNIDQLTNTKPTFVMSINCLTGKYSWGSECFGERFIRHTKNGYNSGALGLVCPSEVSYSFVNDTFVWGMYDNMFTDFMPAYGTTPESRGACPAFGMVAGKYFLKQSSWPSNPGNKKITYYLFHHHSDTFLRLFTQQPSTLTVSHDPEMIAGDTTFTISANLDADIALTVNNEIIGIGTGAGPSSPIDIIIPAQQGGAIIMVTVTKQDCFRYTANVPVTYGVLTAEFTASTTNLCKGAQVNFTDQTFGSPTSWSWTFEGGNPSTSTDENPSNIVYQNPGNYSVTLIVTKNTESDTITKTAYINVYEPPVAAFAATSPCYGNVSIFTDQSNGNGSPITSWMWTFGDPLSGSADTSYVQNPTHMYSSAGTYTVGLFVTNSGCSADFGQDVTVLTIPGSTTTPEGQTELCPGTVASYITDFATFASTYEWVITPAEAGTFTGSGYATDLNVSPTFTGTAAIKVRGVNACDNGPFSPERSVTVNAPAAEPAVPSGADTVDVHVVTTSDFVTAGTPQITVYEWSMTPVEAGTIIGSGLTGTVTWNSNYQGTSADITVKAVDDCGAGNASEVKHVVLKNSVGVGENNAPAFELYPNPTTGKVTMKISGMNTPVDVKIMNTMGSAVFTQNNLPVNGSLSKMIDLSKMAEGIYYVKVEGASTILIQKLIIRK